MQEVGTCFFDTEILVWHLLFLEPLKPSLYEKRFSYSRKALLLFMVFSTNNFSFAIVLKDLLGLIDGSYLILYQFPIYAVSSKNIVILLKASA